MEVLSVLENKISDLLKLVKVLQAKNIELQEKIDSLEMIILKDKEDLDQEKELTKLVVDGIIKNIDAIKSEQQQ